MGEIRVGSFNERFTVVPFLGTVEAVEARWIKEIHLLAAGAAAVGLPTASNMTWILYRMASTVKVHQMLILDGPPRKFQRSGPKLLRSGKVTEIPAYSAETDEGTRISEWSTNIACIRAFLSSIPL